MSLFPRAQVIKFTINGHFTDEYEKHVEISENDYVYQVNQRQICNEKYFTISLGKSGPKNIGGQKINGLLAVMKEGYLLYL
jgi:hypothetical protein